MSGSKEVVGDISLLEHLDSSQNVSDAFLVSDADEQMLLNIHFNQKVRIRSIVIQTKVAEQGPKELKIFTNRPSLGFEDVENADEPETAQTLELSQEEVSLGKPISLRFVRFQNVNSLHIFIISNQGGTETTRIDAVNFFGSVNETTKDLSGLAKEET